MMRHLLLWVLLIGRNGSAVANKCGSNAIYNIFGQACGCHEGFVCKGSNCLVLVGVPTWYINTLVPSLYCADCRCVAPNNNGGGEATPTCAAASGASLSTQNSKDVCLCPDDTPSCSNGCTEGEYTSGEKAFYWTAGECSNCKCNTPSTTRATGTGADTQPLCETILGLERCACQPGLVCKGTNCVVLLFVNTNTWYTAPNPVFPKCDDCICVAANNNGGGESTTTKPPTTTTPVTLAQTTTTSTRPKTTTTSTTTTTTTTTSSATVTTTTLPAANEGGQGTNTVPSAGTPLSDSTTSADPSLSSNPQPGTPAQTGTKAGSASGTGPDNKPAGDQPSDDGQGNDGADAGTSSSIENPTNDNDDDEGGSEEKGGLSAGIIIIIILLVAVVAVAIMVYRKKAAAQQQNHLPEAPNQHLPGYSTVHNAGGAQRLQQQQQVQQQQLGLPSSTRGTRSNANLTVNQAFDASSFNAAAAASDHPQVDSVVGVLQNATYEGGGGGGGIPHAPATKSVVYSIPLEEEDMQPGAASTHSYDQLAPRNNGSHSYDQLGPRTGNNYDHAQPSDGRKRTATVNVVQVLNTGTNHYDQLQQQNNFGHPATVDPYSMTAGYEFAEPDKVQSAGNGNNAYDQWGVAQPASAQQQRDPDAAHGSYRPRAPTKRHGNQGGGGGGGGNNSYDQWGVAQPASAQQQRDPDAAYGSYKPRAATSQGGSSLRASSTAAPRNSKSSARANGSGRSSSSSSAQSSAAALPKTKGKGGGGGGGGIASRGDAHRSSGAYGFESGGPPSAAPPSKGITKRGNVQRTSGAYGFAEEEEV